MLHTSPPLIKELHPALKAYLRKIRAERAFDPASYVAKKCRRLNHYMERNGLTGVVVGVSGGVDSAVVLAICAEASRQQCSSLEVVAPLLMPVNDPCSATAQSEATVRGKSVCDSLGLKQNVIDLTVAQDVLKNSVDRGLGFAGKPWASGQLVSYVRTPALYYATSLLSENGYPAIVIGTTNRDEGAYLGFFGKASDGMVDIQLISDMHKSEVYAVATYLGVPQKVIDAVPSGDMFDGRSDEQVFGTPYDFVELYLAWRTRSEGEQRDVSGSWPLAAVEQFRELSVRLENLHQYNSHKYAVGSPAVHLDIMASAVPGGWSQGQTDCSRCPEPSIMGDGHLTGRPR